MYDGRSRSPPYQYQMSQYAWRPRPEAQPAINMSSTRLYRRLRIRQATIVKCFLTDSCHHRHRSRSGEASPFPQGDHAVSYLKVGYDLGTSMLRQGLPRRQASRYRTLLSDWRLGHEIQLSVTKAVFRTTTRNGEIPNQTIKRIRNMATTWP